MSIQTTMSNPSAEEILAKNRIIYDDATDAFWRLAVYEPLHQGWELSNLGGLDVLDDFGRIAGLGPEHRVLELGSGLGAACRYLATCFGCQVVGVELNAKQIEKARARLHDDSQARVSFECGSLLDYQPDQLFDAVYAVDTLMLIDNLDGALDRASCCLRPGGRLFLAEILAGPNISPETRQFVWEEDGMISLLTPQDYRQRLERLGDSDPDFEDLTDLAVRRHHTMLDALERHRAVIVREEGLGMFERCVELMSRYRKAFFDRELLYQRIVGKLP